MKKIYIAGPMRGIKDFNFPAFFEAAEKFHAQGWEVFNPAEHDERKNGHGFAKSETGDLKDIPTFSLREALAEDLDWICRYADAIAMLPGWYRSKGATAELAAADAIGIEAIFISRADSPASQPFVTPDNTATVVV